MPRIARDRSVALVTHAGLPALAADDQLLAGALTHRGVRAAPAVWDADVDWSEYAAIVLRSCWDYHHRLPAFLSWLDRLDASSVPVMNATSVLRWNADKQYLRMLAACGVPIVPTHWLDASDTRPLTAVLASAGWDRAVVKPSVSASAHETWCTTRAAAGADEGRFRALAARSTVLVQPFVDAVTDAGEWSLVFVAGAYSHAVLKRPRAGEFRVQAEHGGTTTAAVPGTALVAQATAALRAAGPNAATCLYARVDGCVVDGTFVLMELELIEPALFLATSSGAADRLADALVAAL